MVSVAILGAGIFAKEGKIILHRSLVIQKPDALNNKAYAPSLVSLGDQVIVKAVYSRSEKSSRDSTIILKSALGQNAPDPSIYHDGDPHNSLDALLARPDIEAVFVILPISKQPEVVLKALAAGKHVPSEKPTAKDVATGSSSYGNTFLSIVRRVSCGGLQRTSSTSLSIKRQDSSSATAR